MEWQLRLIILYVFVCEQFQAGVWANCQRFTNNNKPEFTDEEVVTIFLYGIMHKRSEIKDIHNFTVNIRSSHKIIWTQPKISDTLSS